MSLLRVFLFIFGNVKQNCNGFILSPAYWSKFSELEPYPIIEAVPEILGTNSKKMSIVAELDYEKLCESPG